MSYFKHLEDEVEVSTLIWTGWKSKCQYIASSVGSYHENKALSLSMPVSPFWVGEIFRAKPSQSKNLQFQWFINFLGKVMICPQLGGVSSAIGWLILLTRTSKILLSTIRHLSWELHGVYVAASESSRDIYVILLQINFQRLPSKKGPSRPTSLSPACQGHHCFSLA